MTAVADVRSAEAKTSIGMLSHRCCGDHAVFFANEATAFTQRMPDALGEQEWVLRRCLVLVSHDLRLIASAEALGHFVLSAL